MLKAGWHIATGPKIKSRMKNSIISIPKITHFSFFLETLATVAVSESDDESLTIDSEDKTLSGDANVVSHLVVAEVGMPCSMSEFLIEFCCCSGMLVLDSFALDR